MHTRQVALIACALQLPAIASSSAEGSAQWRAFGCMVASSAQSLYLYGGSTASGKDPAAIRSGPDTLKEYDTAQAKWTAAEIPTHTKPAILPGCAASPEEGTLWLYDSSARLTKLTPAQNRPAQTVNQTGQIRERRLGSAFAQAGQLLYAHGGAAADSSIGNGLDILDLGTGAWRYASNGPARTYHTLCHLRSPGLLVLFGGADQNAPSYGDVWVFDVAQAKWLGSPAVSLANPSDGAPTRRVLHSAVCGDDRMFLFGGTNGVGENPSDGSVWVLAADGDGLVWEKAPITAAQQKNGPSPRAGHAAALVGGRFMYVFGGVAAGGADEHMYKLDTQEWTWTRTAQGGEEDRGSGSNRVLVAAVVSSVLGVVAIGIASFVFYRWHRSARTASGGGPWWAFARRSAGDGPATPDLLIQPAREPGQDEKTRDGRALPHGDAQADSLLPPLSSDVPRPHNPAVSSWYSETTTSALHSPNTSIIDRSTAVDMYGCNYARTENEYRHAEAINELLLSGHPIPAWIKDAVNNASRPARSMDPSAGDDASSPRIKLAVSNRSRDSLSPH